MSGIKVFNESKARPGSLLVEHLKDVKASIEYYLKAYDKELVELAGLAGICHDVGKNHINWQDYIDDDNGTTRGPNHSDFGAFVFSYLGFHLLNKSDLWEIYQIQWLWLIRDIADHHGTLKNLSDEYWIKSYYWDKYDLMGIEKFIHKIYEKLEDISINAQELGNWIDEVGGHIREVRFSLYSEKEDLELLELATELQKWRILTTGLIMGDRFNVRNVESTRISKKDNDIYMANIQKFCLKNQNQPLSTVRMKAQGHIMQELETYPDGRFYTLCMPTGYGKTITSLKMAGWFIEKQDYKKIVYVAPYLSILEQTGETIRKAMGEKPLEHHSLAILDESDEQRTGENQLWMESWAHSIVCTSFNQFSKAIFPKRAQDVLRRTFLRDCIVIIDEPQIFSPDIWNLFLCGLEGLSNLLNLKIIFVSATIPPFDYGLSTNPISLRVGPIFKGERYKLYVEREKRDETSLGNLLKNNKVKSQAAILNTIEDAYRVYKELNIDNAYLLHGLMIPIHKKLIIEKIKDDLENENYPLYLVSTQVIEAGVDVSFENVFRALPILPSIVQAAGRVNRHGEGEGNIRTFPFYRLSKRDTRRFIYPGELIEITDRLMGGKEVFGENELTDLVKEYYSIMFKQNTYEGSLYYLERAYSGMWEELSKFKPFSDNYLRLPIFVPWDPGKEVLSDKRFVFLKDKFRVENSNEIYEKYSDYDYMCELSFQDRKQFMILFYHYVLNLPVKHALKVASKEDFLNSKIPKLNDSYAYDEKIGFKTPFEEYDNILL
ncbi:MAG TPA: CRISPR-associated helicase Cas3' [Oscillospiraceae bacterium]|nr:CRISPR-associated helicase Cas3' [Oscillospiraceae bacterium]